MKELFIDLAIKEGPDSQQYLINTVFSLTQKSFNFLHSFPSRITRVISHMIFIGNRWIHAHAFVNLTCQIYLIKN